MTDKSLTVGKIEQLTTTKPNRHSVDEMIRLSRKAAPVPTVEKLEEAIIHLVRLGIEHKADDVRMYARILAFRYRASESFANQLRELAGPGSILREE